MFLEAQATPPRQIVLDRDATDDPLHGHQEGRFFHGYSYEVSLRQAGYRCLSFVMAIRAEPGSPTRPKIRVQLISGAATHLADNHDPSCNSGMAGSRSEWDHSTTRRLVEGQITVRSRIHPGPSALPRRRRSHRQPFCYNVVLSVAPLGTSPVLTNRQRAASTLRARAMIATRRSRPLVAPTRSWNQWLSALSD